MTALRVEDVHGGYGGTDILNGVSLAVDPGEVVVVIGPNGAGKSTLMRAIFGLIGVHRGRITVDGRNIAGLRPDQVSGLGLGYVPQDDNTFAGMTVGENLEMGAFLRPEHTARRMAAVFDLFPRLAERSHQRVGTMSGGERQMVALGRALMTEPKLLLLDEPTAGLAPDLAAETFERIRAVNSQGVGILMVEQNARQALAIADRGVVMVMGRDRHTDTGPALLADPEVASLFLGG